MRRSRGNVGHADVLTDQPDRPGPCLQPSLWHMLLTEAPALGGGWGSTGGRWRDAGVRSVNAQVVANQYCPLVGILFHEQGVSPVTEVGSRLGAARGFSHWAGAGLVTSGPSTPPVLGHSHSLGAQQSQLSFLWLRW